MPGGFATDKFDAITAFNWSQYTLIKIRTILLINLFVLYFVQLLLSARTSDVEHSGLMLVGSFLPRRTLAPLTDMANALAGDTWPMQICTALIGLALMVLMAAWLDLNKRLG